MKGIQHFWTGIITSMIVFSIIQLITKTNFSYKTFFIIIIIGALFGVIPDIDHKMSHITWNLMGFGLILNIIGLLIKNNTLLYSGLGLTTTVYLTARFLKHRGLTHKWWFILIQSTSLLFIFNMWQLSLIAFISGLSHLWGDKYFKNE